MSDSPGGTDNLGLSAALATLRGLLTSGETLEAWAAQRRLYALGHRRALIAATPDPDRAEQLGPQHRR